jgi:hypothetical protein
MPIVPDDVGSVLDHPESPLADDRSYNRDVKIVLFGTGLKLKLSIAIAKRTTPKIEGAVR